VGASSAVFIVKESRESKQILGTFQFSLSPLFTSIVGTYSINQEKAALLTSFANRVYPLLLTEDHSSFHDPAFRFFNRGIEEITRLEYPLALIDMVSCMESILIQGSSELRYRFSTYVSFVTQKDSKKRRERYNQVKRLYDKRSKAVHGQTAEIDRGDAEFAADLARKTLRTFLGYHSRQKTREDIWNDLENRNLGALGKLPSYASALL